MVTSERRQAFLNDVVPLAEMISDVPEVYQHPIDADDSHYVNLCACRGGHAHHQPRPPLTRPHGRFASTWDCAFRQQFPHLEIVRPEELLRSVRTS